MADGCGERRPSWAQPRYRLDVRGGLGIALGRSVAGATRTDADRWRTCGIDRTGGHSRGVRRIDGPCRAPGHGRRVARDCRAGASVGTTVPPSRPASAWPRPGRTCRPGALVFHDVHRTRRRIDAGPCAGPPVHGERAGTGNHRIRCAGAGSRGGGDSHGGDARGDRVDRHRRLPRLRWRQTTGAIV